MFVKSAPLHPFSSNAVISGMHIALSKCGMPLRDGIDLKPNLVLSRGTTG